MTRRRPTPPPAPRARLLALALLLAGAVGAGLAGSPAQAALDRDAEASRLHARAEERLARRTIEDRRLAIEDLVRATELAPARAELQLTLARAYGQAGFLKQSRLRYERALTLAGASAEARFGLGNAWRRDWLKYLEPRSLERAVEHFTECGRLEPSRTDAWLMASALQVERGDLPAARESAERALAAEAGRAEAMLAAASTRWRAGEVAAADSLFRRAIERLRRSVRERFEDFAPLATERDTAAFRRLAPAERAEFVRRFWSENDPDLASPENEAQLEYWARVAQAYFLFYDPHRREWDERGEIYVRYGPPELTTYNPVGMLLYGHRSLGGTMRFPLNALVWEYPRLGMTVVMHDRMLSERYELPVSMEQDMDPHPDPERLQTDELLVTRGLRGVFPTRPPGTQRLDLAAQFGLFEGIAGPRLFAGVSASGGPADSLRARLVVLDSAFREVRRLERTLSPSACQPAELRVADFDIGLPPGRYHVGVGATHGARRGSSRVEVDVAPADSGLVMSDLVVTCGLPAAPQGPVRLDPNPPGRVAAGEPLVAYFEVYHLTRGPDGMGRFEYETTVRSAQRDRRLWIQRWLQPRRAGEDLGVTRQDRVLGTVRRQFVSVPVRELPPGRYRLDVTVRDVLSGEERMRSAEFTRE
jgi:GWxTD domain-containing protein